MHATLPVAPVPLPASVSPLVADLSEPELIAAIHASDYTANRNPSAEELAAYATQGLDRLGPLGVARDAIEILGFWLVMADMDHHSNAVLDRATKEHEAKFNPHLLNNISYVLRRRGKAVRQVRSGRACPVCGEFHGQIAPECAAEFAAREWLSCPVCDGTGWDSTGMEIYCPVCGGSKLVEAAPVGGVKAA